jgi:hypothetical protein
VSAASPFPSPSDNSSSSPSTPGPEGSTTNSTIQGFQPQPQQQQQPQQEQLKRAVTPSRSPSLPTFEFDPRNVLNHFSPAQFQQLLASLATQNLSDPTMTGSTPPAVSASTVSPNPTDLKNTESNLTPYHQPSFDFSQPTSNFGCPFIAPEALIPFGPYEPSSPSSLLTTTSANGTGATNSTTNPGDMNLTLLNSASSQEQREHEERMAKEWETTEIMEDNVNGLHSRIHSLAQALGLDAALLDNDLGGRTAGAENDDEKNDGMNELQMGLQGQQSSTTTASEALPSSSSPPPPTTTTTTTTSGAAPTTDFDFDFFFNNIGSSSTTGMDTDLNSGMDYTSTTFLDEVPTPASSSDQTASPVLSKQDVTPEVSGVGGSGNIFIAGGPAKGTRKRKSELAMDLDIPETGPLSTTKTTTGGNKSKRRKDK